MKTKHDLCIIGGAGHVGLPLGVTFANAGVNTVLFDLNLEWLKTIESGKFPFKEKDGDTELRKALKRGTLSTSSDTASLANSKAALLVIGTPVDEHLNPNWGSLERLVMEYMPHFKNGQTLILRSTVYPGTSERLQKLFKRHNKKVNVAFCPERIAQGESLKELKELPQIVSTFNPKTMAEMRLLFKKIAPSIVEVNNPIEAELAKLYSNAWRYIKFAVANQFYLIADRHDIDYHTIHKAMVKDYPRNKDLPRPGLAAGPCLFKDTMQLAAFDHNNFFLGHAAMLINEGMPSYILQKLNRLSKKKPIRTIGILGMAFKAGSDDPRSSLSYKLRKLAASHAEEVLCHDVHIKDKDFVPLETLLKRSDAIILATPHAEYKSIVPSKYLKTLFIDIWNFWQ